MTFNYRRALHNALLNDRIQMIPGVTGTETLISLDHSINREIPINTDAADRILFGGVHIIEFLLPFRKVGNLGPLALLRTGSRRLNGFCHLLLFVAMLDREFEVRYNLAHPRIVMINDLEEVPGLGRCIITDDVYGDSLRKLIEKGEVTPEIVNKIVIFS